MDMKENYIKLLYLFLLFTMLTACQPITPAPVATTAEINGIQP
jgi:hypothetical protein